MPLIPFPSVPAVPGVPALARAAGEVIGAVQNVTALLTGDDPGIRGLVAAPKWGIFDDGGSPVVLADSVVSVEHAKEFRLSNYPIEEGGFESYNKVETPFEHRLVLSKAGSLSDRIGFLAQIKAVSESLELYSVYTPEFLFRNSNVTGWRLRRRGDSGVSMIQVEITIEQVRVTATAAFTQTQSPSGATQQNGGTVQAQTPSAGQAAAAGAGAS